ncbi:unnamed protein product [Calypogeia fissa]
MKSLGFMRGGRRLGGTNHASRWVMYFRNLILIGLIWFAYHSAFRSIGQGWTNLDLTKVDEHHHEHIHDTPLSSMRLTGLSSGPAKELIDVIKEVTRLANGGTEPAPMTEKERKEWNLANPCRSRLGLKSMYARRKYAADVDDNLSWDIVLQEYANLHRTCRQRVGNVKEYFLSRNSSIAGCKFALADYSEAGGLGNKILAVTNTVLYSVLTQRIVLVPAATLVPALMCEPFPGSSWVLEAGDGADSSFPVPPWNAANIGEWAYHEAVYHELDNAKPSMGTNSRSTPPSTVYSSAMKSYQYQPDSRFFCDTEQESFTGVTWLYFTGCLYIIPRFFALPSLRPTLEALFPDRLILTHLVRTIMLPEDIVWERTLESFKSHLEKADRRIGVQIRYRRNFDEYQLMNKIINDRVMKCALDNGVLPSALLDGNATDTELSDDGKVVKLFIASLFTGFSNMLSETYLQHPKSTGEDVRVVQLSSETTQKYGLEIDRQSLVEIMMLSFSDDIFVTPLSTFGGLAQAYGVLVPWIIDYRYGNQFGPCGRGQTVDLCYQEAHFSYSCQYDIDVNGKVISEVVPYIRNCLAVDSQPNIPTGFQLITTTPRKSGKRRSQTANPVSQASIVFMEVHCTAVG